MAISLLSRLAWLGQRISQRLAFAELLETSRLLSEASFSVDELRSIKPELADQLIRISRDLDSEGTRKFIPTHPIYNHQNRWNRLRYNIIDSPSVGIRLLSRPEQFLDFLRLSVCSYENRSRGPDCTASRSCGSFLGLKRLLDESLSAAGIRMQDIRGNDFVPRHGGGLVGILSALWLTVAKPMLDSLSFKTSRSFAVDNCFHVSNIEDL